MPWWNRCRNQPARREYTGSGREARATRGGRVILRRLPEIIYTAELLDANGSWEYGLTEDEVREAFSLITTEWSAGDS